MAVNKWLNKFTSNDEKLTADVEEHMTFSRLNLETTEKGNLKDCEK